MVGPGPGPSRRLDWRVSWTDDVDPMASDTNSANAYLRTKVLTAPPEQLRLMLLDGAIRFATQGREAMARRDHEATYLGVSQCRDIVYELLTSIGPSVETSLAERVRAQVRAIRFELEGAGAPFHATISCGVAAYPLHARGADDARGAVEWADHALYEAKRLGRDRVERADRLATAPDGAHSCGASDHGGKEPRAASTLPPIQ